MPHRLARRALLASLLAMAPAAALLPAADAEASALADLSDEQLTDAATWIAQGTVTDVWTKLDHDTGRVWTLTRLEVSRVLKGPGEPEELVIHSLGGIAEGVEMVVHQVPRWSVGEETLVFLDDLGDGRLATLGFYLGKFTVRRAPGETRHHVVRFTGRTGEPYDHRFLVHPPAHRRVYLDDLVERVEARLDQGWDGHPIPGMSTERLHQINTVEWRRR